ncbi:TPA: LPXTG cell wall anchor domain-containing protein [Streptococcus suis]|uniref:LPXTG cell wall anchor domain-containing protein n=1 Tax=Streptococcus suis TaxID=1307 RepID=UPI000942350A|nr:LPXTG cell wall anchor domain-containing protein [Streptococcus suis]WNF60140.1 LPXTG cell wall anchor domain-containing protein [Streptococcus suis]HEL1697594.1 LPXTG cell wall anchor domain-containing protein [Streptococcus suis]HEL1762921.1 LPXTG cell wall anchor domain-containing protein [Streptococcus suis]HEL1825542.1 LPXTG cell wall anchor domain-containing protein [Streptococcus suis]HEL1842171.1 LPXTG cell wall anchor domain-containing protein [Streptococcus suis]
MSKQKVVSSLLLSTVVLEGLAFYSTTTVKAESLEPDVTSVSSSDATNKLVVSNEEESDFLAEEELEDDETLEEELNEQAEEVAEPSSPEALLQPRAVMSDSMSSDMEEIQVKDEPSDNTAEKVEKQQSPLIQTSNADSKTGGDRETIKKSVTVNLLNAEEGQIQWEVRFDTSAWSFKESPGGFYFVLPKGLELTEIIDNDHGKMNIINNFPKNVNVPENAAKKKYRFFSEEEDQGSFNDQWGWSVGQATPDTTVNSWKSDNRFSKIYFVDQITDTTQVTYTLTAKVTASDQKSFPLMAVMKSFGYKNHSWTEFTSLGARMITLEKEKTLPPKEEAPKPELEAPKPEMPEAPQVPEEQPKDTPAPEVPLVPEEKPMGPEVDKPKPEAPQAPSTPEEKPQVPEAPKPVPEAPKEEPKQEDVQPEAPKSDEVESDKQMPETKKPDMKQPKADDMPKEQQPKAEVPKAEQPQMDKPQMEAPKKDSEAPKSDKAETDKPMPETKKPDMKQPKADDMPKEQQPKAEAPKAEQPQMDKPQMEAPKKDSEAPKSDKAETDKPMSETKQPDMKQPKADKPEAEKAQMPRTEGMKPESKASMMPKAEAPKATLPNTGEASSAIGWLGGALATLATGLYLFKNKKEE